MARRLGIVFVSVLVLTAAVAGPAVCGELPSDEKARRELRRTPLVKLVERCGPCAVDLMSMTPAGGGQLIHTPGSGVIVHAAGYVLTNNKVAGGSSPKVTLMNGKAFPFRPVIRLPQQDLAIVKIEAEGLEAITIGRSDDVMIGEMVVVIGNPMLPHTVSHGVVSRITKTTAGGKPLTDTIQTNAALNAGNEGSPMINADGELIGLIRSKKKGLENVGHGIAIDRLRHMFPALVRAEDRYGFRLGVTVDPFGPAAVTNVVAGSPAAKAGIQAGDVIQVVGKMRVENVIHFQLALIERKPGEALPLEVRRAGKTVKLKATLAELPMRAAEKPADLVNGLEYNVYPGAWQKLPDFDKLKPAKAGKTGKFSYTVAKARDRFGLKFTGYIEAPADGRYVFYTVSDEGSRLWIGSELVVDNDGRHGAVEKSGTIRLKAGKHPITVTYFEVDGGEALKVLYKGPNIGKQEIPGKALFVKKE